MKSVFSQSYTNQEAAITQMVEQFDRSGRKFDDRDRNTLKLFDYGTKTINIKSFKVPNLVNRIAYKTLRTSKAQRSFEYAHKLLEKDILTPQPIAYFEETGMLFGRSFYVSEHLEYDLTYRELISGSEYAGNRRMLEAFARFTYKLHEKEIYFLDHSPGNTLIKIKDDGYEFYLVDLNRMKFGPMDFEMRMKNFERLSKLEPQVAIMASAYAAASGEGAQEVFEAMWEKVQEFQKRFHKKQQLKKKLKFWK